MSKDIKDMIKLIESLEASKDIDCANSLLEETEAEKELAIVRKYEDLQVMLPWLPDILEVSEIEPIINSINDLFDAVGESDEWVALVGELFKESKASIKDLVDEIVVAHDYYRKYEWLPIPSKDDILVSEWISVVSDLDDNINGDKQLSQLSKDLFIEGKLSIADVSHEILHISNILSKYDWIPFPTWEDIVYEEWAELTGDLETVLDTLSKSEIEAAKDKLLKQKYSLAELLYELL